MRMELPVPYEIETSKKRSSRKETVLACEFHEFEIQEHSSLDVFEVANWQQAWNGPISDDWTAPATGNWKTDVDRDGQISRLILIDGKFFSPLRYIDNVRNPVGPVLAENFLRDMAQSKSLYNVTGEHLISFRNGTWANFMARSEFAAHIEENGNAPIVDLKGRTADSDTRDDMKAKMRSWLHKLAVVDGTVWAQIEEPVIAVYHQLRSTVLKIAERRDSANLERTSYFSLADFDAAFDLYQSHLDGIKSEERQVSHLTVLLPEALKFRMEEEQMLRKTELLVENLKEHLGSFPAEVAPYWYTLRDDLAECKLQADDTRLEKLKERALDLCAGINNSDMNEKIKSIALFGEAVAERWELRPF
jgi:hypothetical protein